MSVHGTLDGAITTIPRPGIQSKKATFSFDITRLAPKIASMNPQRGKSGVVRTLVAVKISNFGKATTATVAFGKGDVVYTVPSNLTFVADEAVIKFLTPQDTSGTETEDGASATFNFQAPDAPKVLRLNPTAGFATGGFVVTVDVFNFPRQQRITDASELSITIADQPVVLQSISVKTTTAATGNQLGGDAVAFVLKNVDAAAAATVQVSFGLASAADIVVEAGDGDVIVRCTTPSQASAGPLVGAVVVGAVTLDFDFYVEAPPQPRVTQSSPEEGVSTGGGEIVITIESLPSVTNVDQLVARLGASFASVSSIEALDDNTAELVVLVPPLASGVTTMQVYRSDLPQLKASVALSVFEPSQPRLVDVIPDFSTTAGGVPIVVQAQNFPIVSGLASDLVTFTCGGALGKVQAVLSSDVELSRFVVTPPEAAVAGSVECTLAHSEAIQSLQFNFKYILPTAPSIQSVAPTAVFTTGGLLRVAIDNFPLPVGRQLSPQDIILMFGQTDTTAMQIISSDRDSTVFMVQTPGVSAPGVVDVSVSPAWDVSLRATFAITFKRRPKPQITGILPASGLQTAGYNVTFTLTNFPVVTDADAEDISVFFGNDAAQVASVIISTAETTVIKVAPPASSIVGKVTASVAYLRDASLGAAVSEFRYLGSDPVLGVVFPTKGGVSGGSIVSGAFKYIRPPANVLEVSPAKAHSTGGQEFYLEIGNLFPLATAASVFTVDFSGALGSVTQVVFSDSRSTRFVVVAPAVEKPGKRLVEFSDGVANSVFFPFLFTDSSMEVLAPAAGTTPSTSVAGGHALEVILKNFPANSPDDVVVLFESVIGKITNVVTTTESAGEPGEHTKSTLQIETPAASGTVSGSMVDGQREITVSIALVSDPSTSITFPFLYRVPVAASRAQFAAAFTQLRVQFNQPTNGGKNGERVPCSTVFTSATVALFGQEPAVERTGCAWEDATMLIAFLSGTSNLKPQSTLSLVGGLMPASVSDGALASSPSSVEVLDDPEAPLPIASPSGPETLGVCDPLELDGTGSTGNRVLYQWSCNNDQALDDFLQANSAPTLLVPGDALKQDFKYEVVLRVVDFMGRQSEPASIVIVRSALALPKLSIEGRAEIEAVVEKELLINANADFSGCSEAEQLLFSWEAISDQKPSSMDARGRQLRLPPSSLTPGQRYSFKVHGAPVSNPVNSGSATVTVIALVPPLVARLGGGDRFVSSLSTLELDARQSVDPSGLVASAALIFTWSCTVGNKPCRGKDSQLLAMGASPLVTFASNTLAGGVYAFTLEVSSTAYPRTSFTSQTITMVEQRIPDVTIAVRKPASVAATGVLNPTDKLVLIGNASSAVQWQWTIVPSLPTAVLSDRRQVPLGMSQQNLAINAGVLQAGTKYAITLTGKGVAADEADGVATKSVRVNMPPSSGDCSVSPSVGEAMTDIFSISCSGWRDADPEPLTYEYGFFEQVGTTEEFVQLKPKSSNNRFETLLKAGTGVSSNITIGVYIADADGGKVLVRRTVSSLDIFANLDAAGTSERVSGMIDVQLKQAQQKGDTGLETPRLAKSCLPT
eukprot:g2556.t1